MAESLTIKDFKNMSDAERKKVKKETLMSMILNVTEAPELTDLGEAIKGLTELVQGFRKESEENSNKIVVMKVELELVKNENRQLKKDLSLRINALEQRSRITNIKVIGLRKPSNLETDTGLTLDFLNNVMKANVTSEDLDALHEVPSRRKDQKRIVVVAFKFRSKRDEVLAHKSELRSYNEGLVDASTRIFVNEQLSPENKRLYAMAAKLKYELSFKFLWTKKGVIYMRKDENSKFFRISSEEDLSQVA